MKENGKKTFGESIKSAFHGRKEKSEKHSEQPHDKSKPTDNIGEKETSTNTINSDVIVNMYNTVSTFYRQTLIFLRHQNIKSGVEGINPLMVITIIRNEGIGQDELAQKIRFDKGSMARLIRQMVEKGYVSRVRDPEDGRKYKLYATDKCKSLLPVFEDIALAYEDVIHTNMTTEQILVMKSLMEKASENLFKANKEGSMDTESGEDDEY